MIKKSVIRLAIRIKALEPVDGTKILGRILTSDGRIFTLIKSDKIVVIRRKKILVPK